MPRLTMNHLQRSPRDSRRLMNRWDPRIGRVFAFLLLAGAVAIAGCSEGTAPAAPAGPAASERLPTERPSAVVALASPSDGAANLARRVDARAASGALLHRRDLLVLR